MIEYTLADTVTKRLLEKVCSAHHEPLSKCKIDVMFAREDDKGSAIHCLKKSGRNVFGIIERTNVKRRAAGGPDAVIYLDKADWEAVNEDEQTAMLDDMLESIKVRTNEKGDVLTDSAHRPKLDLNQPDLYLVGFRAVVERNTTAAPETRQFAAAKNAFAQMTLPFFEFTKPPEKKAKGKKGKKGKSQVNDMPELTEAEKDAFVVEQLKQQGDKGKPPPEWSGEYQNLITAIDAKLTAAKVETGGIARESLLTKIIRSGEPNAHAATAAKLIEYAARVMDLKRADVVAHFAKAAA